MDVIFDINGAAEYLLIKKWTLYRLAKKGKVPGIKVGGQWRFKKDVLDNMFYGEGLSIRKKRIESDKRHHMNNCLETVLGSWTEERYSINPANESYCKYS